MGSREVLGKEGNGRRGGNNKRRYQNGKRGCKGSTIVAPIAGF